MVPMIVGHIEPKSLPKYAEYLKDLFLDKRTLFCISSDFCHWGQNFDYTPQLQSMKGKKPWEHIQALDNMGMDLIAKHDLSGFEQYICDTCNTICGEKCIKILMKLIDDTADSMSCETKFVKYDMSEKAQSVHDNSVSYAASYTCCDC